MIEEQFTNKVSMALCTAVDKLSTTPACSEAIRTSCATSPTSCEEQVNKMVQDPSFNEVLRSSLSFYQIDLPYHVNVATLDTSLAAAPPFSCSLTPLLSQNDHWLQLIFQGRQDYFHQKIRFTVLTSVLIVLLILCLFVFAARSLLRQQKISEDNRQFFNHMTHEFSTPLTNIQLASKMISKNQSPERTVSYLNIINQQCSQLVRQVENVLQLASIDQKKFQINKEVLDLPELVHEAVDSMKMQIQEKNAVVEVRSTPDACQIQGDRQHLRNVFRNLIENALKYCTTHPVVAIDFYSDPQRWCARVQDNGHGIPAQEQHKVFDRYYRGASCQNHGIHGFGMGLAYVKKILHLHHGDIRIDQTGSSGTSFELFFPK